MDLLRKKLPSLLGAAALAVSFMATGVMTAAAAPNGTCTGGTFVSPTPIPGGAYRSLTIAGNSNWTSVATTIANLRSNPYRSCSTSLLI